MRYKKSAASVIFDIVNVTVMILFVFLCIFPFYYLIIYSLSDPRLSAAGITWYPKGFTFSNYIKILTLDNIGRAAVMSLSRTVLGTGFMLICSSFYAFLMTKQSMYFRKFYYRALVVTMYVSGGLIPTFLVYQAYGFYNSYFIYILTGMINAYNVVLIKTFIEQLPPSLEESAKLDGAGPFTVWARIIMPLSKPIIATVAVFGAVAEWNSWFDTHLYIPDSKLWTLQYVLYRYLSEAQELARRVEQGREGQEISRSQITPAAVRMTITSVVTIPILFVYPFMQRYFIKGIMIGAVKG